MEGVEHCNYRNIYSSLKFDKYSDSVILQPFNLFPLIQFNIPFHLSIYLFNFLIFIIINYKL